MHCGETGNNCAILDRHVPRQLHHVGQDDVVADVAIVTEMYVRHQQTVLAHARLERLRSSAIDSRVLTNDRAFANLNRRLLTGELQILRKTAEDGADPDLHVVAEGHVALKCRARRNHAPVADDTVLANYSERSDLDVGSQLRLRRDDRGRVDARFGHLSRIAAAMSASTTTSPSTLPTPRILQTVPRNWVTS